MPSKERKFLIWKSVGSTAAAVRLAEPGFLAMLLDNDIRHAPTLQLTGLVYLLIFLLLKPSYPSRRVEVTFWITTLALSAYFLAEVTWIPLLSTIVHTRTSYPYLIVVSHCISANVSYRVAHGDQADRLRALLFGFFLYGFGGSIVSDVLLGLPVTALGHHRIIPCHVLGWYLVWFSPMDWAYTTMRRPDSFLRYFIGAAEAVDAVTTPMGRISRASRELQNKTTAPIAAGLFAGIGGGIVRFLAGEGNYASIEAGFFKTMGYSLLFWRLAVHRCEFLTGEDLQENHCSSYSGSDTARVVIVVFHVVWGLLCDFGVATGHPFVWLGRQLAHGRMSRTIASTFLFGPQPQKEKKD